MYISLSEGHRRGFCSGPADWKGWHIKMEQTANGIRLTAKGLGKTYGELMVLRDVNLEVKAGEFLAIVGRSGCGKSTFLRLISGLEKQTEGILELDGDPVSGTDQNVRFLFQEARLLPWKRILDNVRIGVKGGDCERAAHALDAVGLGSRGGEWPYVLSGGQKQRVALARALVGCPHMLLLDEPLGALDALTRIEMQGLIESIWLQRSFTGILVTHDVSEAVTLADRVILIDDHKIAMNIAITLPRPRLRNNDFAYFEKKILDRVLHTSQDANSAGRLEYSI